MKKPIAILHVEDDAMDAERIQTNLASADIACEITRVWTCEEFSQALRQGAYDLILSDFRLPQYDGLSALRLVREQCPDVPFIFVSGAIGEDAAIECLAEGALDYVRKQKMARLVPVVQRALREAENRKERIHAEQALYESVLQYRQLFEHTLSCIFRLDVTPDRRFKAAEFNPAAEQIFGYSNAQAAGCFIDDVLPAELTQHIIANCQRCVDTGMPVSYEEEVALPAGRQVFLTKLLPMRNTAGEIYQIIGISNNITQQKQTETALQTSQHSLEEERYLLRRLVDTIPDAIYFKDTASRFVRINQATARDLGVDDPVQALGKTDFDFFTPEFAQQAYADEQAIIRSGQALVGKEEKITRLDGQAHWASTTKMPLYNQAGQIMGVFGISRDITGRKQLEAALLESESRYREIFENTPDWVFFLEVSEDGQHFRNLDVNPVFEKMMGISRADLIGKMIDETASPEAAQIVNARYRRCVATRKVVEEEYELTLPIIGRGMFHSIAIPIQDAEGRIRRILGITRNVTQQRQAEQALRESEERYHRMVDLLPDAVVLHRDAVIFFANPTAAELLGAASPEALIGQNVLDMVHPDSRTPTAERIWQTAESKELVPMNEVKLIRTDGQAIDVEGSACQVDMGGQSARLIVFRDITARKQAEEALRRTHAFLDTIVEHIPVQVFVKDAKELRGVLTNRAGEEITGYRREELLGKNDYDLFTKDEADFFTAKDREVLNSGKLLDIPEETIHTKDKGVRILHTIKVPIPDAEGRPQYLLGISEDITARKQAEEALKREHAQVQALLDEQLAFARNISHELRTPLTTLRLRTEALRFETLDDAMARRYLEEVDNEIVRLGDVVQDVMLLARFDSGRGQLGQDEIDVARLATILCAQLEPLTRKRQIVLTLAGCTQPLLVHAGLSHLTVVLRNLLDNALKYTPAGGRVSCTLSTKDGAVEIRIQDTGQGIAPEDLPHIFERFYRAGAMHADDIPGTGLGLTLVKSIVDAYGGHVAASSAGRGGGSTFAVTLPVGDPPPTSRGDSSSEHIA